jgi:preprotein translocase subunit SecG
MLQRKWWNIINIFAGVLVQMSNKCNDPSISGISVGGTVIMYQAGTANTLASFFFHLFVFLIIIMICIELLTKTQKQNHCTSSSADKLLTALDCCCNTSAGPDGIHNQVIAWGAFCL